MNKFSDYLEAIASINDLKNNLSSDAYENPENAPKIQWLFHCGMLFSSKDQWWGDFGFRNTLHEGIDITFFKYCNYDKLDKHCNVHNLSKLSRSNKSAQLSYTQNDRIDSNVKYDKIYYFNDSVKIPAMDDGVILNICDDFLGKTIVIKHRENNFFKKQVLFVYAHILPDQSIKVGMTVKKNNIIATVCDSYKNPQMPCHLHFSCFETSKEIQDEDLNWNFFSKRPDINLINPVFL